MIQKPLSSCLPRRNSTKNRFILSGYALFLITFFFLIPAENNYAQTSKQQTSDCTRSTPVPVVKKSVFPNSAFKLSRDKRTGTETVKFANGDKLTITNTGCEYYYLGFRFETSRFSAPSSDTKYWFEQAVKLIKQTEKGIDAPVQMADAIQALTKYIENTKKPEFGNEIDYGGTDIRTFVSVKKIKKISTQKFALEVYFAVGPL